VLRVVHLVGSERADLLALLGGLSAEQWDAPSLCSGWTVRDVAAHVIDYDVAGWAGTLDRMRSAAYRLDRSNALGSGANARLGPGEIQTLLARHLRPRGLPTLFGGRVALLDSVVHHQDIRRPLGLPRVVPAERLVPALNFARVAYAAGIPRRIRGLSLTAVDLGWAAGRGPRVEGPAEALLMGMAGRSVALAELDGPGVAVLAGRIEAE
jgi:uncharacterized protein (TIGR03083 family)